jgi:t-SNARE complex subunit (syntaxin)
MAIPVASLVALAPVLPKLFEEITKLINSMKGLINKKDIKSLDERMENLKNGQITLLELSNKQQQALENLALQLDRMTRKMKFMWVIIIAILVVAVSAIILSVVLS